MSLYHSLSYLTTGVLLNLVSQLLVSTKDFAGDGGLPLLAAGSLDYMFLWLHASAVRVQFGLMRASPFAEAVVAS